MQKVSDAYIWTVCCVFSEHGACFTTEEGLSLPDRVSLYSSAAEKVTFLAMI
jgi:hypothetical protein